MLMLLKLLVMIVVPLAWGLGSDFVFEKLRAHVFRRGKRGPERPR